MSFVTETNTLEGCYGMSLRRAWFPGIYRDSREFPYSIAITLPWQSFMFRSDQDELGRGATICLSIHPRCRGGMGRRLK